MFSGVPSNTQIDDASLRSRNLASRVASKPGMLFACLFRDHLSGPDISASAFLIFVGKDGGCSTIAVRRIGPRTKFDALPPDTGGCHFFFS